MALTGLHDDYRVDGRVLTQELDSRNLPWSLQVNRATLTRLGTVYKQILAVDGQFGLTTLAVAVGEEPDTIEDVYEPFLLRKGFIQRTPRGRLATLSAYEHLGLREAFERLV